MTTVELNSIEDLHRYCQDLAARKVEDDPVVRKLQSAKQATWLFVMTCAFLFYYLIDRMQEALSILI